MILRPLLPLLLGVILTVKCENILIIIAVASPSHHTWFKSLTNSIAADGLHNITVLDLEVDKNPPPNVHYILLENIYKVMYAVEEGKEAPALNLTALSLYEQSIYEELVMYNNWCNIACEGIFATNGMQQILNYPKNFKFDLIIYDNTCGPCSLFLAERFNNPPIVAATAFLNPPVTTDLVGGHKHVAYTPYFGLRYDSDMNFFERIHNAYAHVMHYLYFRYSFIPSQDAIVRKNIPWDFSYLGDIERRAVLALVNTHPAYDIAEPLTPNTIPVGGLQIKDVKPLPKDLEDFIQSSQKGTVLFSLGTNIRSHELGPDTLMKLIKAFEQMPQYNFLWKFETDTLLPMKPPKNVLIRPFMPQNDLLGHPKIVLFITHAGGLSTIEASWHGVPLLTMPFLVDQHRNSFKTVKSGVGEKIAFLTLTTEEVKTKVLKVIEDPSYRQKMKLRSKRFQDQPEKPVERAVWWVNWAIRNPHPDHMLSPTLKLGFIRSNIYDIIGAGVLLLLTTAFTVCKLLSLCRRKKVVKKIKRN